MLLEDPLEPQHDIVDVFSCSGGGARGIYSFTAANELADRGFDPEWLNGSSTGAITSFLLAKGLREEGERLYKLTYESGSKNIFESDMAQVKDGKMKLAFWGSVSKIFKLKKMKSLMTNRGLYETFLALDKMKPGFEKQMFFNTAILQTGEAKQHSVLDFKTSEDLCMALTASTSMPVILPWWNYDGYLFSMDGGTLSPLPVDQTFARMERGKDYRFWNIMCNPEEVVPADNLVNFFQIGGRALDLMLNRILKLQKGRTQDKNYVSKTIWPIAEELERRGIQDIADLLREALGFRNMPIHDLVYPGKRGVFEFTMESYYEQIEDGKRVVREYFEANKP